MTFDAFETSLDTGEPIELYEMAIGASVFRFNSSEDDYVFNSQTFLATPISRGGIALTGEQRQDTLTVTLPASAAFPRLWLDIVPSQSASLTLRRIHRPDGASPQAVLIYKGRVRSVAFTADGSTASLAVVPISNESERTIPRYTYQGLCNHFLYDLKCKVTKASFQFNGPVSLVSSDQITVTGIDAAKGTGWAIGGWAQLGSSDFRLIIGQTGDVLDLILPFPSDVTGLSLDVFAGCDHSIAVCKSKFNNVINYGGSAYVPLKNIFATGLK